MGLLQANEGLKEKTHIPGGKELWPQTQAATATPPAYGLPVDVKQFRPHDRVGPFLSVTRAAGSDFPESPELLHWASRRQQWPRHGQAICSTSPGGRGLSTNRPADTLLLASRSARNKFLVFEAPPPPKQKEQQNQLTVIVNMVASTAGRAADRQGHQEPARALEVP